MGKKDIAVSKIAVEWLEWNKALWKQSTYSKYYHIVNDIVVVTLPAITILHLSEKVIQSEVNKMLTQNRSASYVRDYVTVINAVLRYAADKGYSCKTKLHIRFPKKKKAQMQYLSRTEQQIFIQYLLKNPDLI